MNLFGKSGMTAADAAAVVGGMKALADAVAERLKDHDKEIAKLQAEINKLNADRESTETATMMGHADSFDLGKAYAFNEAEYAIGIDTADGVHTVVVYRNVPGLPTKMVASARLPDDAREQCAQIVEAMGMQGYGTLAIAAAIRKGKT